MGTRRTRVTACQRKVTYSSRLVASNAAEVLSWIGKKTRAYQCDVCAEWHLTHAERVR